MLPEDKGFLIENLGIKRVRFRFNPRPPKLLVPGKYNTQVPVELHVSSSRFLITVIFFKQPLNYFISIFNFVSIEYPKCYLKKKTNYHLPP